MFTEMSAIGALQAAAGNAIIIGNVPGSGRNLEGFSMGGILLLCGFLACGLAAADALFRRRSGLIRVWLGLCWA